MRIRVPAPRGVRHLPLRASALFVAASAVLTVTPPTAQAAVPANWVTEQVGFITSKQLSNGAILSSSTRINPYFGNLAAMGLARANTAASRAALRKWMGWYLAHLNRPDVSGLSNTVYDYNYDPATGRETAVKDYDSVDSYASTALNVAYLAYTTAAPDSTLKKFVAANIAKYEAIANLLNYSFPHGVRDGNGLTFAKPTYRAYYLMDNSEVYSGLSDLAKLETALGRTSKASYYRGWANTTRRAVLSLLWRPNVNRWDFALGSSSSLSRFYADAAAQLWPIVFGLVAPTSSQAAATWSQFKAYWPNWMNGRIGDGFPWAVMARAGQLMGEHSNADQLLTTIHGRYAPSWTQSKSCATSPCGAWYDAEAGWFIRGVLKV